MARYLIEATGVGFRLSLIRDDGSPAATIREGGSHGRLTELYVAAEETWEARREDRSAAPRDLSGGPEYADIQTDADHDTRDREGVPINEEEES
jgi:hypothetical protein